MNRRGLLLAAAVATAACGKSTEKPGARLNVPTAAVVFRAQTTPTAGHPTAAHPYVAVLNRDGDELRLIDAVDDQVVQAPVVFYPLSVPTGPRPSAVVASPLYDDGPLVPGSPDDSAMPDLLAVVPGGTAELQLVRTWWANGQVQVQPVVVDKRDLRSVLPNGAGAEIFAVIAVPVPGPGGGAPVPGHARIVAALSGARIAVVEVARNADGSISFGQVAVQPAGFQATSLAAFPPSATGSPQDLSHVYAATLDELPQAATLPAAGGGFPPGTPLGVEGVAELDLSSGPPGPWTVRGLSALAPTTVVTAFATDEWILDPTNTQNYDQAGPRLRVYASLDASGCGLDQPINCGVAVLDPAAALDPSRGHLLPDPAGELPYLAPLPLGNRMIAAALPVAFAPSGPPAAGSTRVPAATAPNAGSNAVTLLSTPATGQFYTTAVAAAPSTDGVDHWLDLAHFTIPSDSSIIRTETRAHVPGTSVFAAVGAFDPPLVPPASPTEPPEVSADLGLWTQDTQGNDVLSFSLSVAETAKAFQVTPGYAPNDSWAIAWQGPLPGVTRRRAVIVNGAPLTLATQQQSGTRFDAVVRLYDPSLGVHPGDIVEVWLDDPSICTGKTFYDATYRPQGHTFETTVVDLLPPDKDRWPGGAITLATPLLGGWDPTGTTHLDPGCVFNGPATGFVTIRARGLVVSGAKTLYAGRPANNADLFPDPIAPYELKWQQEAPLQAACTLLPWNPAWETGAVAVPACDATCRTACEQLVLARKARRLFYLAEQCPSPAFLQGSTNVDECKTNYPQLLDPTTQTWTTAEPTGPVLSFRVGRQTSVTLPKPIDYVLQRGAQISFTTLAGLSPAVRRPIGSTGSAGAVLPLGSAQFDRSVFPGHEGEGVRFFSPYLDNLVLDWSMSTAQSDARILR